jgi:hypothetical protein
LEPQNTLKNDTTEGVSATLKVEDYDYNF